MADKLESCAPHFGGAAPCADVFNAILARLERNNDLLARVDTRTDTTQQEVAALTKVVYRGNGQKSLLARIDELETFVTEEKRHRDARDRSRETGKWHMFATVAAGLVLAFAGFAAGKFIHLIGVSP